MSEPFLFTVPTGESVEIEPFHYAIVGQTQFSGKTTLIKRLAMWAEEEGFRIVIFDTKETEADYAGFGRDIPVCLRETTDSFVLIGLLESMFKRRLTPYYATLSRITESAKGFDDIIARAKEKEATTRSPWLKDACRVLYDLLERLRAETSKVKTVARLELHEGINRMVINEFSLEAQQIIMKNSFEDLLRVYRLKTIGVVDEAFKFLPQGYSSAATKAIMNVMTQGAKTELFGWISTQFLAVTDKDPLKACAIKFLGTQDHITEVKHTLDLIPEARARFSSDDIMKLKLGHWILVRKRPPDVRVVYAAPVGVPSGEGRRVAVGEATPEFIRDSYLKRKEVEDLTYKPLWEEEKRKREELEKGFTDIRTRIYQELKEEFDKQVEAQEKLTRQELEQEFQNYKDTIKSLTETVSRFEGENKRLRQDLKTADELKSNKEDEIEKLRKELEGFRELKDALAKILPVPQAEPEQAEPSEISVTVQQPTIHTMRERGSLKLTDKDLLGKISILYANGELGEDWFTVTDVTHLFAKHAWNPRDPRASGTLDDLVRWNYLEKRFSGKRPEYKVLLKPEDAKAKGLLKVEET